MTESQHSCSWRTLVLLLCFPFLFFFFYASPEPKTKSAFNCFQVQLVCTCCPENMPALTAQKTHLHLLPRKHARTYCPENTPALTAQKTHHAKTCHWSASRDAAPCLACLASGPRRYGMQLVEQPGRSQACWVWYPWAPQTRTC